MIAAAPGSGKTALLAQWVGQLSGPVAWLSCDVDDGDPVCFWHDLRTAIRGAWSPYGQVSAGLYDEWEPRQLALEIANELTALERSGVVVIDDFHEAGAEPAVLTAFIAALPSTVRLVLGSRVDPCLPLGRLRVQGRLLEMRQADLRFTAAETRRLLADLDVELTDGELLQLEEVTEGWAAGVQMAALSLMGRSDRAAFLRDMGDTDRSLVDFLVNEVIDIQPPDVQEFLMITAEFDSFDADLCDAVGGWTSSAQMLAFVKAANLFLVELADTRGSHRYHHLFRQFLQARLRVLAADRVRETHLAAAAAYRHRADPVSALRHRILAGDVDGAFDDLRAHLTAVSSIDDRAVSTVAARTLLADHGMDQLRRSPAAVVDCAIVLTTVTGAMDEAATWLRRVEAREPTLDADSRYLVHGAWSLHHLHRGKPAAALERAHRAQEVARASPVDSPWRFSLPNMLIQAQIWLGDLDAAQTEVASLRADGMPPVAAEVRAAGFDAYLSMERGDLELAGRLAAGALAAADRLEFGHWNFGRAEPELVLADLAIENNRLTEAQDRLERVMRIVEGGRRPPIEILAHLEHARIAALVGEDRDAEEALRLARRVQPHATAPVFARIDRVAARLAIDRGDLFTANTLISRLPKGPSADLLEARRLLATAPDQARSVLAATQLPPRMRRLGVEHGLLTALALGGNDQGAGDAALETALLAAQEGGFVMSIVREGPPVWKLLESLPARAMLADYLALLLDTAHGLVPPSRPINQDSLIEPLSERELTVLRHLASRLDSTEIAGTLYLSVNTVRSHIKAIYRKLGVNTRTEAVDRGRELALF